MKFSIKTNFIIQASILLFIFLFNISLNAQNKKISPENPAGLPPPIMNDNYKLPLDEQMTYKVKAFGLNIASQKNTTKGIKKMNGRRAVNIFSSIKTHRWIALYSINNSMETFLDAATLKPIYYEERAKEKDWAAVEKVEFSQNGMKYHAMKGLKLDREESAEHEYKPEEWPQDELSLIYYVRHLDLAPGKTFKIHSCIDKDLETAVIEVVKKQKLKTIHGKKDVFYVTSSLGDSKFYVGADEQRIPYRFEVKLNFGVIKAYMTDYQASK